jgi:pimeloyl-[acyl-carrier protein] synthase
MEDVAQIERWTADIAATVTPVLGDEVLAAADRTIVDFHSYLRKLVADRRNVPQDDLLTAMVQAEDNEGRLDDDELVSFAVTLLGAGTETTTNLIGVGTLALWQNPDQLARLRQNPDLVPNAVEELLRFEPPVQMGFVRVALEDTVLGGEEIVGNELVVGLIGAANHDPAAFPDPGQLRVDRPFDKRPHLSFGQGVHYCMGSHLGRLEGEIALRTLLVDRFPNLTVDDSELTWRNAFTLRGVEALTVSV